MKNQALFSSKDRRKKIKMTSAAIFAWHLRIKDADASVVIIPVLSYT